MSSVISSTGRRPALLIAGILLIATTLRVVFTGAAPLLDAGQSRYRNPPPLVTLRMICLL
ncbi:hypothetical protein CQA67_29020 [Klebsiella pneumoniae]|nr:hypothetical protein CQA67_29020 [Klebsiella pneumoniae]